MAISSPDWLTIFIQIPGEELSLAQIHPPPTSSWRGDIYPISSPSLLAGETLRGFL